MSVAFDLDFVEKACGRLFAIGADDNQTGLERQALWISAVVVYARCFLDAKRAPLPSAVTGKMTDAEKTTRDRIIRERHKYVAHVEVSREEILAIDRIQQAGSGEPLAH